MPPLVIQTENLPKTCSDWLAARSDFHTCPADSLRFSELLPTAEGLVIRTYTQVDRAMIESAPSLRVVGRAGAGIDNIDLQACKEHGVRVVHTPEANAESVVEFVLAHMLPLLRKSLLITHAMDQGEWSLQREAATTPFQFNEMTLGIVGFGRIGSRLGRIARSIGFRVVFNDILQKIEMYDCQSVDLDTLLHESHALSIHVDGRHENRHLCDATFFEKMREGAVFINTSRGFVVDAQSLVNHLRHDDAACAVLDVHEPEPIQTGYPLLDLPNAHLYPHIACKTQTATVNMGWVVKDVDAVLRGETPEYEVPL